MVDRKFIIAPGARPRPGTMYHFEGTFARPEYRELENGIIGDATKATREKGEKIVTRLTDHVAELIEDIRNDMSPASSHWKREYWKTAKTRSADGAGWMRNTVFNSNMRDLQ